MRKGLLTMFLLALVGMAGNNVTVMAQTPEPSGQWTFSDPNDLMKASKGNLVLTPAVMGNSSITEATVAEAGITTAEGRDGSSAIFVPKAAALKVARAEGAEVTSNYTFMMDMKVPNAYVYDGLFQTSGGNANDGDLFISKGQIGIGALGGYYGRIWNDFWYRIVFTMSEGVAKAYVNGQKVFDYETTNARYEIDPWGFYLHCDEDGEMSDTYISEVAFWETPLTDEQVAAMGGFPNPWITSISQIQEGEQFFIISDRAKFNGSTTAQPKAMSTLQSNYAANWGEMYVYWGDLNRDAEGFIWTAEKVGDQWAFLNKENNQYLGNMNEGEADVIFSATPVGYTLTDLAEDEGCFYMSNEESDHSLHVQGYLRNDRGNNSLAKQEVGDDDYEQADPARNGYPGRWRLVKVNGDTPEETAKKIATAEDLSAFADEIAKGNTTLDAVLTADINLSQSDYPNLMIGTESNPFSGIFDGQGFTITYKYENVKDKWRGLFAFVKDATISNLRVEGSAYVTNIHFGALIGRADGTVFVENVITNVDITGALNQVTGDGGMLGANYANITFSDCATLGKMGHPGSSMYSSFSAWSNGSSSTTLNNCYSLCELTEGTGTGNCFTLTHPSGSVSINNCYYLNLIGTYVGGTQITAEEVANGALCFKLNGDQSVIGWTQTIGTDLVPQPGTGSQQVYATGTVRCDGEELPDNPIIYTNTKGQITKPDHKFGNNAFCSVCGSVRQNDAGFYMIGSAEQLNWLAQKIEEGKQDIPAVLTTDIDLSKSDYPNLMIGTETKPFKGVFNGAGFTITYNYEEVKDKWRGLFAFVDGATIRNLNVEGEAKPSNIHFGALIGKANGKVLVENVITNVNITGLSSTGVQGDGGMVGANYANMTFYNCATLGKMGHEGSSMYSSFSGWTDGNATVIMDNCYSLCQLTDGTGTGNCFTLSHGNNNTFKNCYYLNEIGTVQKGTQITAEQIANGELCVMLGDGWYQNIGEDAYPVPDKTHGVVKKITEAGYATMYIDKAVDAPEGVEVYTGVVNDDKLTLNAVEGSIPAWEPVVLKGAAGFYSFMPASGIEKSVTVNFPDLGYENAQDVATITSDDVDIDFSIGTGANNPKYYNSGTSIRFYGGNVLTVTASSQPITKIIFNFAKNYAPTLNDCYNPDGDLVFDFTTIPGSQWIVEEYTWEGVTDKISFFRHSKSGHYRIIGMTVTYAASPENVEGNDLKGTAEDIEAAGKYVLAKPEGKPAGFYLADKGTIKAGKAYLEDSSNTGPLVKAFYFNEEDATAIESVNANVNVNKGAIYNLSGQRVSKAQNGIFIIDGKKVLK